MTPRLIIGALLVVAAACSSGSESASTSTGPPDTTAAVEADAPASTDGATTTPTTTPTTTSTTPATTAPTTAPLTTAPAPTTAPPTETTDAPLHTAAPPPDLTDAEMADQALARTALITLESFPDGWTEEPNTDDDSGDDEFESEFDACLGRDDDERVGDDLERLAVSTGDFEPADDEATSVSHEVVLAPDVDTAITAMAEVSVEGAESCIADVVQRFYQTTFADDPDLAGIAIGEVVVTRTERERPADVAVGVLLEIPLTLDTQTVGQFLEVLYQRQGRALSELSFTSLGSPFSRDGYTILSDEAAIGLATIGN